MRTKFKTPIRVCASVALAFSAFAAPAAAQHSDQQADQRAARGDGREAVMELREAGSSLEAGRHAGAEGAARVLKIEARVTLPPGAEAVQVTAAATEAGVTTTGSVRTAVGGEAGQLDAGAIVLTEGEDCAPEWVPTFGGRPGVGNRVDAMTVFDDGSEPSLLTGGLLRRFTRR